MYALILNVVVAFALMACTANSKTSCSQRSTVNLKTISCDQVHQSDLCRCCTVDPCDGVTCMHGGKCVGEGVCECVSGYSGPTCNINPCENVECLNGGECVGEGVCNCTFGFGGADCSLKVCNVNECENRGGECYRFRCKTDDCGDCASDEVCLNGTCVDEGDNCRGTTDDMSNVCSDQDVPCGEGFCRFGNKCVNNTCRFRGLCGGDGDGDVCKVAGNDGTCSGGVCLEPCRQSSECSGYPCIGGFCASAECGDSFCIN